MNKITILPKKNKNGNNNNITKNILNQFNVKGNITIKNLNQYSIENVLVNNIKQKNNEYANQNMKMPNNNINNVNPIPHQNENDILDIKKRKRNNLLLSNLRKEFNQITMPKAESHNLSKKTSKKTSKNSSNKILLTQFNKNEINTINTINTINPITEVEDKDDDDDEGLKLPKCSNYNINTNKINSNYINFTNKVAKKNKSSIKNKKYYSINHSKDSKDIASKEISINANINANANNKYQNIFHINRSLNSYNEESEDMLIHSINSSINNDNSNKGSNKSILNNNLHFTFYNCVNKQISFSIKRQYRNKLETNSNNNSLSNNESFNINLSTIENNNFLLNEEIKKLNNTIEILLQYIKCQDNILKNNKEEIIQKFCKNFSNNELKNLKFENKKLIDENNKLKNFILKSFDAIKKYENDISIEDDKYHKISIQLLKENEYLRSICCNSLPINYIVNNSNDEKDNSNKDKCCINMSDNNNNVYVKNINFCDLKNNSRRSRNDKFNILNEATIYKKQKVINEIEKEIEMLTQGKKYNENKSDNYYLPVNTNENKI